MRVEWHGQSAFTLTGDGGDGLHRPVRRHVGAAGRPRDAVRLPADRGRRRRPAARHPRAPRPQRGRGDRRRAGDAALDRRHATSRRSARWSAIASEHDDVGRHRARPEHDLRLRRSTASASPTSATSARRALRPEQARGDRRRRPALPPGRRRPDDRRRAGGRDRRRRSTPRWVVPMHYRTPRIGFLETEEEFVAAMLDAVERLDGAELRHRRAAARRRPAGGRSRRLPERAVSRPWRLSPR